MISRLQTWRAATAVVMLLAVLTSAGQALAQTTVLGSSNVGVNLMTGGNINNINASNNKFIINPIENYIIVKNIKEIHKDNDVDIKSIDKLLSSNDYNGAIKKANFAIEKSSSQITKIAYLFYIKGLINSKQRKWDVAAQEFNKAAALDQNSCKYLSGLLLSEVMSGEYNLADKIIDHNIERIKICGSTQEAEEKYSIYDAILTRAATTNNSELANLSAKELADTIREILNKQTNNYTEKEITIVCSINKSLANLYFNYEKIDANIKNSCVNIVKQASPNGKLFAAIFFDVNYDGDLSHRNLPEYGELYFGRKIKYLLSKNVYKSFWFSDNDILIMLGWLYRDRGFWSLWNQHDYISANRDYAKAYNIFYSQGISGTYQGYHSWSKFFRTVDFFDNNANGNEIFGAQSITIPEDAKKLLSIFIRKNQTAALCDLYLNFLDGSVNLWKNKYNEVIKLYEDTVHNCIKNGKFPAFESNWLNMRWHAYLAQKNSLLNANESRDELILAKKYGDNIVGGPTRVEISSTYKYILSNIIPIEISNDNTILAADMVNKALASTKIDSNVDSNYLILLKFSKAFIELLNNTENSLANANRLLDENNVSAIYDCGAASIYTNLVIAAAQVQSTEINNLNFGKLMHTLVQIAPKAKQYCLGIYINKPFMDSILLSEIFFITRFYGGEELLDDVIYRYAAEGVSEEIFNKINSAAMESFKKHPILIECSKKYNFAYTNLSKSSKIKSDLLTRLHKNYPISNINCI